MGRKKAGAAGGKQKTLAQAGAFPLLAKGTSTALGRYCNVPGKYWAGCAAADKQKIFKCLVVDFIAVHDFGGGVKGAGMHVKEMGESGTGSLEVGVASGDVFVIAYPTPFLQFFYDANPEMLPSGMRPVTEGGAGTTASADVDLEGGDQQEQTTKQEKTQKPPVFDFLNPISSTLVTAGRKRGCYSNKYTCGIDVGGRLCGASITLYANGPRSSETSSNAFSHIRSAATNADGTTKCEFHKVVIDKLDDTNANRVLKEGHFVPVMSFAEAFPHHVDYVWCRADGVLGAHTGKKPSFRRYVRGAGLYTVYSITCLP